MEGGKARSWGKPKGSILGKVKKKVQREYRREGTVVTHGEVKERESSQEERERKGGACAGRIGGCVENERRKEKRDLVYRKAK